jgi:predicted phage terminase large subunit-like protein
LTDPTLVTTPDGATWRAPSLASADRERVRWGGFSEFARQALRYVPQMPARPLWEWHLDEVCVHYQALMPFSASSGLTELLLNVPPGHTKSTLVSVCGDAWAWTVDPTLTFMHASFDPANAQRHANYTISLIQSAWYRERWGDMLPNPTNQSYFATRAGGTRFATSVGSKGTGWHGQVYAVDDPIKAQDAMKADSKTLSAMIDKANNWIGTSVLTRGSGEELRLCLMMQRLHELDCSGFLSERFSGFDSFAHLYLPWQFEGYRRCVTRFGGDRRTQEGEVLSRLKSPAAIAKIAASSGGFDGPVIQSQYQQNPTPPAGTTFAKDYLQKRFTLEARPLRDSIGVLSVDAAFKGKSTSDFVAIEVWGWDSGDYLCYYSDIEKRTFSQTLDAIVMTLRAWPGIMHVLIEDAANGPAIVDTLTNVINQTVIPVQPRGGKETRAQSVVPYFKSGRVYFLEGAAWLPAKLDNLIKFPRGRHDDDVDATTQAITWLMTEYGAGAGFSAAVDEWREQHAAEDAEVRETMLSYASTQLMHRTGIAPVATIGTPPPLGKYGLGRPS